MKIPFDIKFRPQIESGEYKVETREGRPVKIISFEVTDSNNLPIAAQFRLCAGTPVIYLFDISGEYKGEGPSNYDLFIVTPEPELTDFEKGIKRGFLCAGLEDVPTGIIKDTAKELLDLAKKEICKGCSKGLDEYWRGRKEAMEEASRGYHYEGPTIPAFWPPCHYGGVCTNSFRDCSTCPRGAITVGINTTTGTSTAKVEGK